MISSYLVYPIRGSRRLDTVLIGGGLHLLAVWLPILPFVAVAGYLARVLATTARAESHVTPERPEWQPVRGLLRDGLRLFVTAGGYLAAPVVLLTVTLGGPLESADPTGTINGVVFLVASTTLTMLALALCYPLPAALVAVARDHSLRAAVDTRLIAAATQDAGYLVATLLTAGGLGVMAAAYIALNQLALGFFIGFYLEVVAASAIGKSAGRAWDRQGLKES